MHRLILMRHAEAELAAPGSGDRERTLSPRGQAEAAAMARMLVENRLRPDVALVSSAVRTRQTWEKIEEAIGDAEVRILPELYNASADTLRRYVEDAEEEAGCLLVMAHNPGVHQLAVDLLNECAASPAVLDRLSSGFPTAAAAVFEVDQAGRCAYDGFLIPRGAEA